MRLGDIAHRMTTVHAETLGHLLLDAFLKRRSHLFAVQDSEQKMIGIVTLEDVIEEILGKEIVDEREANPSRT